MRNRRVVTWVRLALYAEGVLLALAVLSFFALGYSGGEGWRKLARFFVGAGALGVFLLVLAMIIGIQMDEDRPEPPRSKLSQK